MSITSTARVWANLVGAFTSVQKQAGELKLLGLTNKVHDLMQITRLYTVFEIIDDEAAAVKSSVNRQGQRDER